MISIIPPFSRISRTVRVFGLVCLLATFAGVILVTAHNYETQLSSASSAQDSADLSSDPAAKARVAENFGRLPLSFEINKGQIDQSVKFLSHGPGYDLFLTANEAVLRVPKPRALKAEKVAGTTAAKESVAAKGQTAAREQARTEGQSEETGASRAEQTAQAKTAKETAPEVTDPNVREGTVLRLKLLGANNKPETEGQDELPGKVNYFAGSDPANWRRNIPTYRKAYFKDVYPGIDVVYYGQQQELEYDLIVAPRANPKLIRFSIEGADKIRLDKSGRLQLTLKHGEVSLNKPVIYQVAANGARREIKGGYSVNGNEVRFKLESFDSNKPLVIDPILSYSTLLGSSSSDIALGIAIDASGNAFVTGSTDGTNFPTTAGSFKSTSTRGGAFVSKLNANGTSLIYSTYINGNNGITTGNAIAVDSAGNAHITGSTNSSDFPTVNGLKTTSNFFKTTDSAANWNNQNSGLTATSVNALAVAPNTPNTIYTASFEGVFRSSDGGTTWTKATGNGLSGTSPNAMAVDPTNASVVYVGTFGNLFKTTDGGNNWALVSTIPLNFNTVSTIVFDPSSASTIYVGASNGVFKSTDSGATWITQNNFSIPFAPNVRAIAVDPSAPLTVYAGTTNNGLFKSTNGGGVWTAMNNGMGGPSPTFINSVVIDPSNTATIYTGHGNSGGINKSTNGGTSWAPLTNGVPSFSPVNALVATSTGIYAAVSNNGVIKTTNGGTNWSPANAGLWSRSINVLVRHPSNASILFAGSSGTTSDDAFVTKLNASGSGLLFSTLLGGSFGDVGKDVAVDGSGNILVAGETSSVNFPVANAVQSSVTDTCSNGFVTKLNPAVPSFVFSTYLGGNQCDTANSIATDASGNVYVTGTTGSSNFPTLNAFQPAIAGTFPLDAFVTKLTSTGALSYSTYLGGSNGSEVGYGIAVDASGNAYVTGSTESTDFKTMNPLQPTNGSGFGQDAFLTKLNSSGSALVYSTYLGGSGLDAARGVALDSANNVYLTGYTDSLQFPLTQGSLRTRGPIFKSTDGAANWSNDNYGFTGVSATCIAIDPKQPSTLYAGTFTGIFKSVNGGRTWSPINNGLNSLNVVAIVVDPITPSTVYAATPGFSLNNGIYKSTDGGASWNRHSNGLSSTDILSLAIDKVSPNVLYVGVQSGAGSHIYKTTDGANNWALTGNVTIFAPQTIAIDPLDHTRIYAADETNPGGVYKTIDSGVTWNLVGGTQLGPFVRTISVSPFTANLLYANSGQGLFKSTNGGVNWTPVPNRSGRVVFDPVTPSTIYLLSSSQFSSPLGIFKSTDSGQTWLPINKGLNSPIGWDMVIDPSRPSTLHLVSSPASGLDAFVTKVNAAGSALVYSTLLGGPLNTNNFSNLSAQGLGIAADSVGNAYVTGQSATLSFPVSATALQPFIRGSNDAFVSKLTSSYIISGKVLESGGAPVSGADVVLTEGSSLTAVVTESDGSYQFARLRDGGTFTVTATKPHFTMAPTSQTFTNLKSDQVLNFTATVSASAFFTISGKVTENSVGLSGVTVTLSGSQPGIRTTDSNGNYSFELVGGGNYTITPSIVGFNFSPANSTFNTLSANQTANFAATRQSFVVTNTNNHGAGSLRDAINNANASPGPDTITFNIPGTGSKTISLLNALPEIIDRVTIDATTQPGYAGTPIVEIDGLGLGSDSGLVIRAGGSTVRGLSIGNFRNTSAIWLNACDNNTIQGNFLGVANNGTTARPNLRGVLMTNSNNNLIGGTTAAAGNVISGNTHAGVEINGNNNTIQGNRIGTNAAGTAALSNPTGVAIFNPTSINNVIGGTAAGAGNLISGNSTGIQASGNGTTIQGNLIGTDVTGTSAIPNNFSGVQAGGLNVLVGGVTTGSRNVISGNFGDGVFTRGAGNKIQGNFIGTDITGTLALGNRGNGVVAGEGALIGGTQPEARNIISANGNFANVSLGLNSSGSAAIVQGNYIGTDVTGTRALVNSGGNPVPGINISSSNNIVGGATAAARNVISGNSIGIQVGGFSFGGIVGNLIQGNFIGLNAAGTGQVPNTQQGISISDGVTNTIGGTANGAGNKIAFNGGPGITISNNSSGNAIRGNSIFSNNGLGIDLSANGVTPNDVNDSDSGPNQLQNFPVLTTVMSTSTSTTIQGSLKSIPNTAFQIDFYSNAAVDPSGNGEGAQFFNTTSINTDNNGNATINVTFQVPLGAGRAITATATDPNGNTSEFSATDATGATGSVQFSVSTLNVVEDVGVATVTVLRTGGTSGTLSVDYATANGTAVAGQDYTSTAGTLTFNGGETSKTIQIPIADDSPTEPDENFTITLSNTPNIESLGAPSKLTVTIQDRSTTLGLSITSASIIEGNSGTKNLLFTVNLSAATGRTVSASYGTANFNAFGGGACSIAGADYELASGAFTIQPGSTSFTIPIKICGDPNAESNEFFVVNLSNASGASILLAQGVGTINDDDVLELVLEESGPDPNQAAALDTRLQVRDPFRVLIPDWLRPTETDQNTRIMLLARGLQLNPGEPSQAVVVRFTAQNGAIFEIQAEDVRPVPNSEFTQVSVRLPNVLFPSTYTVFIRAHQRISNTGVIRIVQ